MKRRKSLRHLLFAMVLVLSFSVVGYADPLIISIPAPGVHTFVFQNVQPTATATDFQVLVLSPSVALGNGFGGTPFPVRSFQLPVASGGFLRFVYDGGPGIPAGGTYTHSFTDFQVGTVFSVTFSYLIGGQIVFLDPRVLGVNTSVGQGLTRAVPEPTTLLLLSTGLAGVAIKTRKRLKTWKRAQGN